MTESGTETEEPPKARLTGTARPLFLWGAARSGTNIVTWTLEKAPDVVCYNEDHPAAFENFFLRDDATVAKVIAECPGRVAFLKAFNDTPRAIHVMRKFPTARAVYIVRKPADTIASWVGEFSEQGTANWINAWTWQAAGGRIPFLKDDEHDPDSVAFMRSLSRDMLTLMGEYGTTWHNVGAAAYLWQNEFFFRAGFDRSDRVRVLVYSELTQNAFGIMGDIAKWMGVPLYARGRVEWHKGRGEKQSRKWGAPATGLLEKCEALYDRIVSSRQPTKS